MMSEIVKCSHSQLPFPSSNFHPLLNVLTKSQQHHLIMLDPMAAKKLGELSCFGFHLPYLRPF